MIIADVVEEDAAVEGAGTVPAAEAGAVVEGLVPLEEAVADRAAAVEEAGPALVAGVADEAAAADVGGPGVGVGVDGAAILVGV